MFEAARTQIVSLAVRISEMLWVVQHNSEDEVRENYYQFVTRVNVFNDEVESLQSAAMDTEKTRADTVSSLSIAESLNAEIEQQRLEMSSFIEQTMQEEARLRESLQNDRVLGQETCERFKSEVSLLEEKLQALDTELARVDATRQGTEPTSESLVASVAILKEKLAVQNELKDVAERFKLELLQIKDNRGESVSEFTSASRDRLSGFSESIASLKDKLGFSSNFNAWKEEGTSVKYGLDVVTVKINNLMKVLTDYNTLVKESSVDFDAKYAQWLSSVEAVEALGGSIERKAPDVEELRKMCVDACARFENCVSETGKMLAKTERLQSDVADVLSNCDRGLAIHQSIVETMSSSKTDVIADSDMKFE